MESEREARREKRQEEKGVSNPFIGFLEGYKSGGPLGCRAGGELKVGESAQTSEFAGIKVSNDVFD